MKNLFQFKKSAYLVIALFFSVAALAQPKGTKGPIPSPRDSVSGTINGATIKIEYGSPSVKGRKIFGEKEPYGKVWRAGANEATVFTTDKDIMVGGKTLPAGTYGFFLEPTEGKWVVIFNKVAKQWGAFKYDEKQDQLRVEVTPVKIALQEKLVYTVNSKGFEMKWDNIEIPVKVK